QPIEDKKFIAIRFSGRAIDANFEKHKQILLQKIAQEKLDADLDNPIRAYYNNPWTLPFLKRNEVLFALR
ncbi:MAG: heme-binding protein, partial [Proteobacteria bacterium]|nr:heme-binding protein [Pseudomonadota bacterium]